MDGTTQMAAPVLQPEFGGEEGSVPSDGAAAAPAGRAARCKAALARIAAALRPYFVDEAEEMLGADGLPLNGGINPLIQSNLPKGELQSKQRYFLTVAVVTAGCAWWVAPLCGIFVADPMIQLLLSNFQVLTPRTDCYDPKLAVQTCEDAGIQTHYFFHNITNVEAWLAGDEPPAYKEVGPYAFASNEVHYNLSFDKNWTQVGYTYHTYQTFDPERSCPTCRLDDSLTVINRGYQQFCAAMRRLSAAMAASDDSSGLPQEQVEVILMPLTLADIQMRLVSAVSDLGSADPMVDALQQWVDCAFMRAQSGDTEFFLPTNSSDATGLPYAPELCYFISTALQAATGAPTPVPPSQFAALGYELPLPAAAAWMQAAIGNTSAAGPDPAAQAFVTRFLLLTRDTNLAYLAAADPALAAALAPITPDQWPMLQGYLASLLGTYSSATYSLFMAYGGAALIQAQIQRVAARWMAMAAPTPEQAMVYTLLPLAANTMLNAVTYSAMLPQVEASFRADPSLAGYPVDQPLPAPLEEQAVAAARGLAIQQWADCSVLGGAPLPVGPGGFPHPPELCAFIAANADSLGFNFPVTPAMLPDLGLALPAPVATAFLEAIIGGSTATSSDPFAQSVIQTFMMATSKAAALAWLGAQPGDSPAQAAALAALTDPQFRALQLYLISLLPSWGKLVYVTWVHAGQAGPGVGGIVVTRTAEQLLYGYEDPILLASAQMTNPTGYRLAPYYYTVFVALSFPTDTWPVDYFTNVTGTNHTFGMLSYKDSDVGAFHPLIQQKTIVTGKRRGDFPQTAAQYRGLPFFKKAQGILNVTGYNEGVVQGTNFKPDVTPVQYESSIVRAVKVASTGAHIQVRKVDAYQMTLHQDSSGGCNATLFAEWKNATGFDEQQLHAAMAALDALKQDNPAAYWELIQDQEALTIYLNSTDLGSLGQYFGPDRGAWLARCANPEAEPWSWDVSDTYTCPTLVTLPRFYKSSDEVVDTTGAPAADWDASFVDQGWYFSVEPFTGMSIHGHKGFQFNQLISRTDVAYPNLWVANGSRDSALGRAMGMDADFVTVPLNQVLLYWEPTRTTALALRGIATAKEVLYWLLVVGFPIGSWFVLFSALIYLKFSKAAKLRKRELGKLQKSRAKHIKLGRHEKRMAEALYRLNNGSKSVFVPPEQDFTPSDTEDEEAEVSVQQGSELTQGASVSKAAAQQGGLAAAVHAKSGRAAAQSPPADDGFSIGTAPQGSPGLWVGGQEADSGAGLQEDAVAVTLLPPGEELSSVAPGGFRRSTGGELRKRTTSTMEGP